MEANIPGLFSLIKFYLNMGSRHWQIILYLSHIDGSSLSTLLRHLRTLWLVKRVRNPTPKNRADEFPTKNRTEKKLKQKTGGRVITQKNCLFFAKEMQYASIESHRVFFFQTSDADRFFFSSPSN